MKKKLIIILSLAIMFLLSACSNGNNIDNAPKLSAANSTTTQTPQALAKYEGPPSLMFPEAESYLPTGHVVIPDTLNWDLSGFSTTMAYAQLYNVYMEPENFVGQSFKIKGRYLTDVNHITGVKMHFVSVADETACCELPLEFLIYNFQGEYPKEGSEIVVAGLFDVCNDNGEMFVCLRANDFELLREGPEDISSGFTNK